MTRPDGPRDPLDVAAEQVAGFREAIQHTMGVEAQRQADAVDWINAGLPANPQVTAFDPGPEGP